ncbi:hypothetical protein ACHAPU_003112 [Fusarium lateritium]
MFQSRVGEVWEEEENEQTLSVTELTVLNPSYQDTKAFHQFARFPPEIRRQIWEESLTRERMLNIRVVEHHDDQYTAVVKEEKVISKLFRINRESRDCARQFYRVQMPARYGRPGETRQGILYLNPDIDIINIHAATWKAFALFANGVWVRDKNQVGIANLALDWEAGFLTDYEFHLPPLLGPVFSRLRKVIFILPDHGIRCTLQFRNTLFSRGPHYVPVWTPTPYFDTMPKDPRLLQEHDVKFMLYHSKSTTTYKTWTNKVTKCGVQLHSDFQYQLMICRGRNERCHEQSWENINREQAIQLSSTDQNWLAWAAREKSLKSKAPDGTSQRMSESHPPLLFGFWLLDLQPDQLALLTNGKLIRLEPQLCLSHLPG